MDIDMNNDDEIPIFDNTNCGRALNIEFKPPTPWKAARDEQWINARRLSDEAYVLMAAFLHSGATIKQCPPIPIPCFKPCNHGHKQGKYVFSDIGKKHADKLRKRAERANKEAQEELDWFRRRALPKPYIPWPKWPDRCVHPDTIKAPHSHNTYEDHFLAQIDAGLSDRLTIQAQLYEDTSPRLTDEDTEWLERAYSDEAKTKWHPGHDIHNLTKLKTNFLDRLFGYELDEKKLTEEGLREAPATVQEAWIGYMPAFYEALREQRKEDSKSVRSSSPHILEGPKAKHDLNKLLHRLNEYPAEIQERILEKA